MNIKLLTIILFFTLNKEAESGVAACIACVEAAAGPACSASISGAGKIYADLWHCSYQSGPVNPVVLFYCNVQMQKELKTPTTHAVFK